MIHKHALSFKNAFEGLVWGITTQRNYKIHLSLSLMAITGGLFFHISYIEMMLIVMLTFIGLAIEMINTAIEATLDVVDKTWRPDIKIAKDVAAASMLIFAIGAVVIACMIFIPHIIVFLPLN
jgi:diacylglycerol kinase